jgi:hypothetical protein
VSNSLVAQFDGIVTGDHIEQFVRLAREEDSYLEFKGKAKPSHGELDGDDKKTVSRALSAFANAGGGILILGVRTRRDAGIDKADVPQPITDVQICRARLEDFVHAATQPIVDGVLIREIKANAADGYLKILIPASDKAPHMAMQDHAYYRRTSQERSRLIEHFELEDMFGRRQRPALKAVIELSGTDFNGQLLERLGVHLLNENRAVAKHAGFTLDLGDASIRIVVAHDSLDNQSGRNHGRPILSHYLPGTVIHPNGIASYAGYALIERPDAEHPLRMSIRIYAEDMQYRIEEFEVSCGETVIVPRA